MVSPLDKAIYRATRIRQIIFCKHCEDKGELSEMLPCKVKSHRHNHKQTVESAYICLNCGTVQINNNTYLRGIERC